MTGNANPHKTWLDISRQHEEVLAEVLTESDYFKFPGRGQQQTPVVGARGLVTIMNLLQGEKAALFRAAEAGVCRVCRWHTLCAWKGVPAGVCQVCLEAVCQPSTLGC